MSQNNASLNKLHTYFSENAIRYMIEEISKNGGNEVYFVGNYEGESIIDAIRVVARGNKDAVPVIYSEALKGDYIIHNHPSGNLTPSDNDISIASNLGNQGIGFAIINNEVSNCNLVVELTPTVEPKDLDVSYITNLIKPNGLISKNMPTYEYRKPQEEMLKLVCQAIQDDKISILEAGTGTGKSLAYLIPAIYWSINNKEKVIVSTNTINLQQQLINKDIPFLKKALGKEFSAILVKGRSNYICLRKLHRFKQDFAPNLFEPDEVKTAEYIFESVDKLKEGSKDELSFLPNYNIWEEICSDADSCNRQLCTFTANCFFIKARSLINKANILVVNHHILCSDIAIKKDKDKFDTAAILPPYWKVVIDEAHNFEDAATSYFGNAVSPIGMKRNISLLYLNFRNKERGALSRLMYFFKDKFSLSTVFHTVFNDIERDVIPYLGALPSYIDQFFEGFYNYILHLNTEKEGETKLRLKEELVRDSIKTHVFEGKNLISKITSVTTRLSVILDKITGLKKEWLEDLLPDLFEANSLLMRINNNASCLENFLLLRSNDHVYWAEWRHKKSFHYIKLYDSPLDISEILIESFFDKIDTGILTSATLAINGNFNYIETRLGLSDDSFKGLVHSSLPSPFDYSKQSSICIPNDIVEPEDRSFIDSANKYIYDILNITRGSTFILFTSFYQLNNCYNYLQQHFGSQLILLKQGTLDRHTLISKFREGEKCVLLGTDSFWEGVDVEGDALRCVIIVKLPFRVPSEPLIQARVERINNMGRNAFTEYYLPQTVLKFKQGFGRLIRSKTDRGLVITLDKRIITKHYGKLFLNSLPACRVVNSNLENILNEVKKYF